jgi:hypothetical protein
MSQLAQVRDSFKLPRAGALLFGILTGACADSAPELDLPGHELATSAHFSYFVRNTDAFQCNEITEELEKHRDAVFDYFDDAFPERRIHYYKFQDADDLIENGPCFQRPPLVAQCQRKDELFAYEAFQRHELIHAYTGGLRRSVRFLDEGLAEALSCGLADRAPTSSSLEALIAWASDPETLQTNASTFVAHLLHEHGQAPFLETFERLDPGASFAEVEAAFQNAYGAPASELYLAAQREHVGDGCVRVSECAGEGWDTSTAAYTVGTACCTESFMPFEVAVPSLFVGVVARLGACSPTLHVPSEPRPYAITIATTLEPGKYFLGMPSFLPGLPPSDVPAALHPIESVVGEATECGELETIDAPLNGLRLSFEPRTLAYERQGPFFLRLRDDLLGFRKERAAMQGAELTVSAECTENVELWLCEDCGSDAACTVLCTTPDSAATAPPNPAGISDTPVLKVAVASDGAESDARISLELSETKAR